MALLRREGERERERETDRQRETICFYPEQFLCSQHCQTTMSVPFFGGERWWVEAEFGWWDEVGHLFSEKHMCCLESRWKHYSINFLKLVK
jgi:hypothetical protein